MAQINRRMVMGFRFLVLIGLVVMTGCEEKASSKTPPRPQQWGGGTGSFSWVQLQTLNPQATLEAAKASVGSIFDADQKKQHSSGRSSADQQYERS